MNTSKREQELEQVRRLTDSHQQILQAMVVHARELASLIRQIQGASPPEPKCSHLKIKR